jgi:hypothetical protein
LASCSIPDALESEITEIVTMILKDDCNRRRSAGTSVASETIEGLAEKTVAIAA